MAVRNKLRAYFSEHYQDLQDIFLEKKRKKLLPYLHIEHGAITKKMREHPAKELAMIKNLYMMYPLTDAQVVDPDARTTILEIWQLLIEFHQFINRIIS